MVNASPWFNPEVPTRVGRMDSAGGKVGALSPRPQSQSSKTPPFRHNYGTQDRECFQMKIPGDAILRDSLLCFTHRMALLGHHASIDPWVCFVDFISLQFSFFPHGKD
jgi:hypothetical protein